MGEKRIVQSWIGILILAIIAGFAFWAIKQYAPQASTASCNPGAKAACINITVNGANNAQVSAEVINGTTARVTATTNSAGVANLRVPLSRERSDYDITIGASKSGYQPVSNTKRVRGGKRYSTTLTLVPNSVFSSPPLTTPVPRVSPSPAPSCTPIASPLSAARACLTIRVKDTSGRAVVGASVSAPGVITRGETDSNGLAGPYAVRMSGTTNNGVVAFTPRTIQITTTLPYTVGSSNQNLLQKITGTFTVRAAANDQTTLEHTIPTPGNSVANIVVPVDPSTACTTECAACEAAQVSILDKIFSIERAHAAPSPSPSAGNARICVRGTTDPSDPQRGLFITSEGGSQWQPGSCTPVRGQGGPYTKVMGHQFALCELTNIPSEGTPVTFTIKGRLCGNCTEVYTGSITKTIKPGTSPLQRVTVPASKAN